MNANPAIGNKKGGITTIVENLGAVVKGGTSSLIDVLRYSEKLIPFQVYILWILLVDLFPSRAKRQA